MLLAQISSAPDNYNAATFWFVLAAVAFVGACIGSFLNVVIHRVPREESIVFPNSRCPSCGAAIRPYDNIPVISYLILRGRCRACRAPIAARYPAVEALTAFLFALTFALTGLNLALPFNLVFVAVIVALVFIDAEHMILPDAINYPALAFALIARALVPNLYGVGFLRDGALAGWPAWGLSLVGALVGAVVGAGFLWLMGWIWQRLFGVEGMGLGDVKMMAMVGAYLGWPLTILTIFIAVLTASIVGVAQTIRRAWHDTRRWKLRLSSGARAALFRRRTRRGLKSSLPFGIFLGIGSIISLLVGLSIISWYLSKFTY
ncbi:MAG TPA: prepilin peptidase [Pyrinomonadaceae bacterium]|jgi:leader peptidase (prepilin peptidase)/N-methyltransferase|nr:prepilin peptidase [Pyrinomonadaceae bacterium]